MPRIPRRVRDSDVTWIIALWRALHSADVEIEDVAAEVTAIFSQYLPGGSPARFEPDHVLQTLPAREVLAYEDSAKEDFWQISAEEDECLSAFDRAVNEEKAREKSAETLHNGQEEIVDGADALSIRHYYFKFKGRTYCFELPALPCSPAAA